MRKKLFQSKGPYHEDGPRKIRHRVAKKSFKKRERLLQLFELVFDDEVMGHLYYQPELYILIKITLPSTMLMK